MNAPEIIETTDHLSELEAEIIATCSRARGVAEALAYLCEKDALPGARAELALVNEDLTDLLDVHLRKRFEVKLIMDTPAETGEAGQNSISLAYAEWRTAKADLRDMLGTLPRKMTEKAEEKASPLYDRIDELEREILSMPAASAHDLAVKLVVALEAEEPSSVESPDGYIGKVHREALGMIVRAG